MNGYKKIEIKLDREKTDVEKNEWETNDEVLKAGLIAITGTSVTLPV